MRKLGERSFISVALESYKNLHVDFTVAVQSSAFIMLRNC